MKGRPRGHRPNRRRQARALQRGIALRLPRTTHTHMPRDGTENVRIGTVPLESLPPRFRRLCPHRNDDAPLRCRGVAGYRSSPSLLPKNKFLSAKVIYTPLRSVYTPGRLFRYPVQLAPLPAAKPTRPRLYSGHDFTLCAVVCLCVGRCPERGVWRLRLLVNSPLFLLPLETFT